MDVVVRTKKVGHFFPGGTVDAYDTWLELKGTDDKGQTIFWSGMVEDDGKGPVEKGAHFYRSLQIDAHGNPDQQTQCLGHPRCGLCKSDSAGRRRHGPLSHVDSRKHRQQDHSTRALVLPEILVVGTQFAFAGILRPGSAGGVAPDYDDRPSLLTASLTGVSAKEEKIPDVPIVTVAENEVIASGRGS